MKKISNKELLLNARCETCNHSNSGQHDDVLLETLGKNKKIRPMYLSKEDKIYCSYCTFPEKQYHEVNNKTKKSIIDPGELEKEIAYWNNILKEEGLEEVQV